MFTSILLLTPFLVIAFLPMTLGDLFSPSELDEMGVCLEDEERSQYNCPFQGSNYTIADITMACANA